MLSIFFAKFSLVLFLHVVEGRIESAIWQHPLSQKISVTQKQEVAQALPVRLRIPSINVDAAIEYVGITDKGEMAVPTTFGNVGWFALGPRPGGIGSAVIAGHLNGDHGEGGVFNGLTKLKSGDQVYVEDVKGKSTVFVVRSSKEYDPGYANEVFSSTDSSHLNLITCDGFWNIDKKTYTKRLVVFADRVH